MRLSIRHKLLLAFALDLLLVLALGSFAAQQMRVMNTKAAFVETYTIPALDTLGRFSAVINRYRVLQLEYLIYTSSADKDRIAQRMVAVESEMAANLAAYRPLVAGDAERERFAAVEAAWIMVVTANHTSFLPAARLANTGSVQPFYSRMNPSYNALEVALQSLAEVGRNQANDALGVVREAYSTARRFIIGDTLLTLVISAAIGLIFSGRLAHRIGRLTGATHGVAAGHLDRHVPVSGNDELSMLGRNFNAMVDSLRQQRGALEERNRALQTSLARQEQLTVDLVRGQRAEQEAYQAQAAAEAASQAKSMFLATMSHELRTPLNVMLGYAQLLRIGGAARNTSAEDLDQLDRILAAGRHLTNLISDVLDFSKIERGAVDLQLSVIDVGALLAEVDMLAAPLIAHNRNTFRIEAGPGLGTLYSDAGKLRQILLNLLSNAAKFTTAGAVTLRVSQDDDAQRGAAGGAPQMSPTSFIIFQVIDTGIGIAPEHMHKLFQPFSQIDDTPTRRYEGTGLGLALSRQLAMALGGNVSVSSTPARGSIFTLWVPTHHSSTPATELLTADGLRSYR